MEALNMSSLCFQEFGDADAAKTHHISYKSTFGPDNVIDSKGGKAPKAADAAAGPADINIVDKGIAEITVYTNKDNIFCGMKVSDKEGTAQGEEPADMTSCKENKLVLGDNGKVFGAKIWMTKEAIVGIQWYSLETPLPAIVAAAPATEKKTGAPTANQTPAAKTDAPATGDAAADAGAGAPVQAQAQPASQAPDAKVAGAAGY